MVNNTFMWLPNSWKKRGSKLGVIQVKSQQGNSFPFSFSFLQRRVMNWLHCSLLQEMFHHQTKLAIVLTTIFLFCSAKSQNNHNCHRRCGEQSVQYPFGFSDGCKVKLSCSISEKVKIGDFEVEKVNPDSIFISVPAKCNRSMSFMEPLFGDNFAPTWNNTFLVQGCESKLGGCVIPTSSFIGSQIEVEGCDRRRSENITCLTQSQRQRQREDVLTREDWEGIRCKSLFSAIAVDRSRDEEELSLQFQVVELGWWLQGRCNCSHNATCEEVHLAGEQQGYRCRCREGFAGDGFVNGTGCRRGDPTHSYYD